MCVCLGGRFGSLVCVCVCARAAVRQRQRQQQRRRQPACALYGIGRRFRPTLGLIRQTSSSGALYGQHSASRHMTCLFCRLLLNFSQPASGEAAYFAFALQARLCVCACVFMLMFMFMRDSRMCRFFSRRTATTSANIESLSERLALVNRRQQPRSRPDDDDGGDDEFFKSKSTTNSDDDDDEGEASLR